MIRGVTFESSPAFENEAVEAVRSLIRIESVNTADPATTGDGETRAARWVQAQLEDVGITVEFIEPVPGRGSVVARIVGTDPDAGALLLHAHLDVVPVVESEWTHPPFGAEIHNGFLYGRGAVDMKNFAGVLVAAAREIVRSTTAPRRDLVFAFVADEESGGIFGASWLVDHRPDLFAGVTEALSEVGGFSIPFGNRRGYLLATAEKGVAGARLTARGAAAHASRPQLTDPLVRLAGAVARIGEHRFPIVRSEALTGFVAALAGDDRELSDDELERDVDALGFPGALIRASLRNTLAPTVMHAGTKSNIIPGEATAIVDIRPLPSEDEGLRSTLIDLAGDGVEVSFGNWWSATEAPTDGPLVRTITQAIGEEDPDGVIVPYLLPASTDNKHFARLGIAGYGFVPLRVPDDFDVFAQFHAADERVPVESVRFSARVTLRILQSA